MMVSEKVVLREDVARPAAKAATNVERLAGALGELGSVNVDAGAAAKIERTAKAASAAQDRAMEAAKRAAAIRETATRTEEKAREAAERVANATREAEDKAAATAKKAATLREEAAKAAEKAEEAAARAARLRENGVRSAKAEREAERAATKAARLRASAARAEETAKKRSASVARAQAATERQAERLGEKAARQRAAAERAEATAKKRATTAARAQSSAEKAQRIADAAAEKRSARAQRAAEREESRRRKGVDPKVSKTEGRLSEAIRRFNPAQERREAMLERQLRTMRKQARAGLDDPGEGGQGGGPNGAGGGRAAAAAALAAAATAAAAGAARAAYALGSAAVDAAAFREDVTRALSVLRRTQGDADRVFQTAVRTADFIGQGRQETLGQFVDLLGKGFDTNEVDRIVRSIADLGTVNPSANVDSIVRAMGKIKAQGYLQGDELTMLTEAGLSADKVYGQLAQRLGKSAEEIRRMQGAGQLGAADTIEAILAAINEQAGGRAPGLAARAKSLEDISGLLGRLRALPENLLMDLGVTPGMRSFKSFVGGLLESLDPSGPRWTRITSVLGKVLNSIFGTLFDNQDPGKFIDRVLAKVELAAPLISAAFSGFRTGFGGVIGIFEKAHAVASGPLEKLTKWLGIDNVPWIELVAKGVGLIAGVIGVALGAIGIATGVWASFVGSIYAGLFGVYGALVTVYEMIEGLFTGEGIYGAGQSAGIALVDGFVGSIRAGALAVASAVKAMAGGAISTAKNTLGIASPSRVFEGIGWNMASGAEVGISGGAGRVVRAAEAMAFAATRAANDNIVGPSKAAGVGGSGIASSVGAQAPRGGVYSGDRVTINVEKIEIVIQGSATERDGEAVARGLWAELQRLAEEAA
ncbi:tape measure protein [Polyangium sp. y55x31]|uniref:tape measure protein n=1 Tax=Polyangium sp. y55x31 TaxID=3042688 RepID=UPI002482509E|nr:tape measure protein [Polyangium sp. y55x31]MDI1484846.1 tape measure protein [Polyangium sp. y55x31]